MSRNDVDGEKCISAYSSPAAYLKEYVLKVKNKIYLYLNILFIFFSVSSTDFDVTVMNESVNTSIDFNDTVTDEIANTSTNTTNTSVIVNESPRTNLFPIFINGTPSSSHIIL